MAVAAILEKKKCYNFWTVQPIVTIQESSISDVFFEQFVKYEISTKSKMAVMDKMPLLLNRSTDRRESNIGDENGTNL